MAPKITLQSTSSRLIPATHLDSASFSAFGEVVQNPSTHNGVPAVQRVDANQGSATKWLDVTSMRDHYRLAASRRNAKVVFNMFVCKPRGLVKRREKDVFEVKILERHPFTPQTFIPLGLSAEDKGTSYLVIVAPTLPLSREQSREKRTLRGRLLGARPNLFTHDFAPTTTPVPSTPADHRPKGPGLPDLDNLRAFVARGDQAVTYGAGTWHAPMVVLGENEIDFVVVQFANGIANEDCQEVEIEGQNAGEGIAVVVEEAGIGRMKAML